MQKRDLRVPERHLNFSTLILGQRWFLPRPQTWERSSVKAKLALSDMNEEEFTQKPCHKEFIFSGPYKINIWSSGPHEVMGVYWGVVENASRLVSLTLDVRKLSSLLTDALWCTVCADKKKKSKASSRLIGFRYSIPDLLCWVGENWGWFSFQEPRALWWLFFVLFTSKRPI